MCSRKSKFYGNGVLFGAILTLTIGCISKQETSNRHMGIWVIQNIELIDTNNYSSIQNNILSLMVLDKLKEPKKLSIDKGAISLLDSRDSILVDSPITKIKGDTIFMGNQYGLFTMSSEGSASFEINNTRFLLKR